MRISDWSSDVCSSDLHDPDRQIAFLERERIAMLARTAGGHRRADAADDGAGDLDQRPHRRDADHARAEAAYIHRQSVVLGKSVSERVDLGGCATIHKKQ